MNILTDELPDSVNIGGRDWAIRTEFFRGVAFELIMQDDGMSHEEKIQEALGVFYDEQPRDIQGAVNGILWFYRCGKAQEKAKGGGASSVKKAYCFEQDGDYIFSAFYAVYGIDLTTSNLHWWAFRALFFGLPADCEIKKIIGYRTADTKEMSKAEKKRFKKLREIHALKNKKSVNSAMSLAERDKRMKDYVAQRYAEMEASSNH